MTLLSEQLSAASSNYLTAPMNAQITVLNALATQALDNASRITALNLSTSQEALERSAQTARQLIGARDARDLAVLRSHAEEQVRSLFAYSRELFGIATSVQPLLPRTVMPEALAAPVEQATQAAVDAGKAAIETAQAAAERTIDAVAAAPAPEPVAVAPEPEPAPESEPEPEPQAAAPETPPTAEAVAAVLQEKTLDDAPALAPKGAPAKPTPIATAAGNGAALAAMPAEPAAAPVERRDPEATPTPTTPRRRRK